MRFRNLVTIFALVSMTFQAHATSSNRGLRRAQPVAQASADSESTDEIIESQETTTKTKVKVISSQQPTTVVEAQPIGESKAELLRKARESEEVHTEQRIVEKLEESRLREERERAKRLFGNKIENGEAGESNNAPAPIVAPAPAPVVNQPAAPPPPAAAAEAKDGKGEKATHVTIEKLEIIQPINNQIQGPAPAPAQQTPVAPAAPQTVDAGTGSAAAGVAVPSEGSLSSETKGNKFDTGAGSAALMDQNGEKEKVAEDETAESSLGKIYVGGILALPTYEASNVTTNYGLGVNVSKMIDAHWGLEAEFLYSNFNINNLWGYGGYGIYTTLNQYQLKIAPKYYFMEGKFRPYVGVSGSYLYRQYQDRIENGYYWGVNQTKNYTTNAFGVGLLGGMEYEVGRNMLVGAGVDYDHPLIYNNNFYSTYQILPGNAKPLEEIDMITVKIYLKFGF